MQGQLYLNQRLNTFLVTKVRLCIFWRLFKRNRRGSQVSCPFLSLTKLIQRSIDVTQRTPSFGLQPLGLFQPTKQSCLTPNNSSHTFSLILLLSYSAVFDKLNKRVLLVARHFLQHMFGIIGTETHFTCATHTSAGMFKICKKTSILNAENFEHYAYQHPIRGDDDDATYRMMPGDFVELDKGTGFVHCAPAHGKDDFAFCKKYNLPLVSEPQFSL